jgi:hypothetical protein
MVMHCTFFCIGKVLLRKHIATHGHLIFFSGDKKLGCYVIQVVTHEHQLITHLGYSQLNL